MRDVERLDDGIQGPCGRGNCREPAKATSGGSEADNNNETSLMERLILKSKEVFWGYMWVFPR